MTGKAFNVRLVNDQVFNGNMRPYVNGPIHFVMNGHTFHRSLMNIPYERFSVGVKQVNAGIISVPFPGVMRPIHPVQKIDAFRQSINIDGPHIADTVFLRVEFIFPDRSFALNRFKNRDPHPGGMTAENCEAYAVFIHDGTVGIRPPHGNA
ncbi:MAG: hypothetical protein BWY09_01446 [Candidatus Hydrogenedentes bacterium ADurb.Bin179]|nr:MAG: hypothetical protein BWY09_01446 [Candidatus Hydrogenedentes bacterium ADurb.Bin179]